MSAPHGMDRRSFFKLVGGGIVVFIGLDPSALFSQDRQRIYPEQEKQAVERWKQKGQCGG